MSAFSEWKSFGGVADPPTPTTAPTIDEDEETVDLVARITKQRNPNYNSAKFRGAGREQTKVQRVILSALTSMNCASAKVDVVESGFAFMKNLVPSSKKENSVKSILESDGVSKTVFKMKNNPCDEVILYEGRALLNLVFDGVEEKTQEDGIKAILTVMETLPDDAKLLARCCEVLCTAAGKGFREFIGDEGAIPLVVSAMKNHPKEKKLLQNSLRALGNLVFQSNLNCERVADADGIKVVLDAMKRPAVRAEVLRDGITVLGNLAFNSDERTKAIVEAGGHLKVVSYMKHHPDDPVVQENGCWTLTNLAYMELEGAQQRIIDSGVIPAILNAMKLHPSIVEVQTGACTALINLSLSGEMCQSYIIQNGGLEAICASIRIHSADKDFVLFAKRALDNVTSSIKDAE